MPPIVPPRPRAVGPAHGRRRRRPVLTIRAEARGHRPRGSPQQGRPHRLNAVRGRCRRRRLTVPTWSRLGRRGRRRPRARGRRRQGRLHPRRGADRHARTARGRGAAGDDRRGRRRAARWPTTAACRSPPAASGTGLSGACVPRPGGIVVSFERMAAIVEIDTENYIAVVEPGVHARPARRRAGAPRARLPGVPRRVQRQPGRQRRHQRRRHAGREVRRDPPPRARPRGGAGRRAR